MSTANGQLDPNTLSALQLNPDQFAQGHGAANGARAQQAKQNSGSTGASMKNGTGSTAPAMPAPKTP